MYQLDYSKKINVLQESLDKSTIEIDQCNTDRTRLAETIKNIEIAFAELEVN